MSNYPNWSSCIVAPEKQIHDVLQALHHGAAGVALIVDKQRHLLGIMTDGDIRRALLKGATLNSSLIPYMNRHFTHVSPSTGRAEVLDLMQARTLSQVPIVDSDGNLLGLHLLRELIGASEKPNWAVVMAGGKGTRLRPLTESLPKPMIQVAGRPILERILLHLVGHGIKRIFFSINYLGHVIEEYFGDGSRFGCQLEYLRESQPMGTGGALSLLPTVPANPLLVLNGDLVTQVNFDELLNFHSTGRYAMTIGARKYFHRIPFGCLQASGDVLEAIEEKPLIEKLINAGIYAIQPEILHQIPKEYFPLTDLIDKCVLQKKPVGIYAIQEDWVDIGHPDQLRQARGE